MLRQHRARRSAVLPARVRRLRSASAAALRRSGSAVAVSSVLLSQAQRICGRSRERICWAGASGSGGAGASGSAAQGRGFCGAREVHARADLGAGSSVVRLWGGRLVRRLSWFRCIGSAVSRRIVVQARRLCRPGRRSAGQARAFSAGASGSRRGASGSAVHRSAGEARAPLPARCVGLCRRRRERWCRRGRICGRRRGRLCRGRCIRFCGAASGNAPVCVRRPSGGSAQARRGAAQARVVRRSQVRRALPSQARRRCSRERV